MNSNKKLLFVLGGVVVVGAIGWALDSKYHWFSSMADSAKSKMTEMTSKVSSSSATVPPGARAPVRMAREARGKLPWAVGDVSLWDDEKPNYCSGCAQYCNTPFSEGHSTQCDMCMAKCPNVIRD
jgi:hypothetical protein